MSQTDLPIYLDYNATTPIAPQVRDAMLPFVEQHFGNPSSSHAYGQTTAAAVQSAREQVATLLACEPGEVVFTGGGSESDNMALVGRVWASGMTQPHIITSVVEHPAILTTCRFLERQGATVTYLPVDSAGQVDPDAVRHALTTASQSSSRSCMPTTRPAPCSRSPRSERSAATPEVPFHTDASQSVGKVCDAGRHSGSRPADDRRTQAVRAQRASARSIYGRASRSSR